MTESNYEKAVAQFWNENKDSGIWTGAYVNLDWSQLWPEARQDVRDIFDSARRPVFADI